MDAGGLGFAVPRERSSWNGVPRQVLHEYDTAVGDSNTIDNEEYEMSEDETEKRKACCVGALQAVLGSQYHAALDMLCQGIERCPESVWFDESPTNAVWQIAYHTLFFAHLYLQPTQADFRPWEGHQANVQNPDGIAGPPDPNSSLPLLPKPYAKEQVLAYWRFCNEMVNSAIERIDLLSPESGFPWYKVSKLEHQLINIRHIQHGAAQIADRVRQAARIGVDWVGAKPVPD